MGVRQSGSPPPCWNVLTPGDGILEATEQRLQHAKQKLKDIQQKVIKNNPKPETCASELDMERLEKSATVIQSHFRRFQVGKLIYDCYICD